MNFKKMYETIKEVLICYQKNSIFAQIHSFYS